MSDPARAQPRRLRRETRTVELMIRMHCRDVHGPPPDSLCPDCTSLLEYAFTRVADCRFGAEKPVCSRCTVHCFRPTMREQVRAAMRYSGPRMTYRHPYLALQHLLDRRKTPDQGV